MKKLFSQILAVLYVTLLNWVPMETGLTELVEILQEGRQGCVEHSGKKPIQLAHCIESYRQNGARNVLYVPYGIAHLCIAYIIYMHPYIIYAYTIYIHP